jgi:hypothetical protein
MTTNYNTVFFAGTTDMPGATANPGRVYDIISIVLFLLWLCWLLYKKITGRLTGEV